jgi:hypothetical protein
MYKTKDMNLATVFLYFGAKLLKIEKDPLRDARASFFVFEGNIDFEGIEADYWKQELLVEPKRFFYTLKDIKGRLYNDL